LLELNYQRETNHSGVAWFLYALAIYPRCRKMATTTTTIYAESHPATFEVDDSRQASLFHIGSNTSQAGTRLGCRLAQDQSSSELARDTQDILSPTRAVILITALTGITFVGSMSGGLLTIGLPEIAADLKLPENLLLW
jgi:hypothetical protein